MGGRVVGDTPPVLLEPTVNHPPPRMWHTLQVLKPSGNALTIGSIDHNTNSYVRLEEWCFFFCDISLLFWRWLSFSDTPDCAVAFLVSLFGTIIWYHLCNHFCIRFCIHFRYHRCSIFVIQNEYSMTCAAVRLSPLSLSRPILNTIRRLKYIYNIIYITERVIHRRGHASGGARGCGK